MAKGTAARSWLTRATHRLDNKLILVLILGAALGLRLIIFTDMSRNDDLDYAHQAMDVVLGKLDFSQQLQDPISEDGWRFGFYVPIAFFFWLLGPGGFASFIFPLLCSLLGLLFVILITKELASEKAGWLAGLIWLAFPLDVHLATALMPDGPMLAFSLGAIYFYLRWLGGAEKRWQYFFLGLFMLLWSASIKPYAAVIGLLLAVHALIHFGIARRVYTSVSQKKNRVPLALVVLLFLVTGINYVFYDPPQFTRFMDTAKDFIDLFWGQRPNRFDPTDNTNLLVFTLAPLFFVSFISSLRKGSSCFLVLWAAFAFALAEWGPAFPAAFYAPLYSLSETRNFLFVFVPLRILAGTYLSEFLESKQVKALVVLPLLLTPLVAFFYKAANFSGWPDRIIEALGVIAMVTPVCLAMNRERSRWVSQNLVVLLALLLPVALLHPTPPDHSTEPRFVNQLNLQKNMVPIINYLQKNPEYPIYVFSDDTGLNLNYVSNFSLGFNQQDSISDTYRIKLDPLAQTRKGSFYAVFYSDYRGSVPSTWWKIAEYGDQIPNPVFLYRSLSKEDAEMELSRHLQTIAEEQNELTLTSLYGAAVNAGDLEEVERAWVGLSDLGIAPPLEDVFALVSQVDLRADNLLHDPEFYNLQRNWQLADDLDAATFSNSSCDRGLEIRPTEKLSAFSGMQQEVLLQEGRLYVFAVDILSDAPARGLQLGAELPQTHDFADVYGDWFHFTTLVFVPGDSHQDRLVSIEIGAVRSGSVMICNPVLVEFAN